MSSGGGQRIVLLIINPATGLPFTRANLYHYTAGTVSDLNVYTDEDLQTPAAQPIVSTDGYFTFFAANFYKIKVTSGTPGDDEANFDEWDKWDIRQHHDGRRPQNLLTSYPAATTANKGHVVYKYNENDPSPDTIAGVGININESSFTPLISYDANGNPVFNELLTKVPVANVKHPDFSGGASIDGSTDDSAPVQAAASSLTTGGILLIPQGSGACMCHGCDLLDNTIVIILGEVKIPSGESGTYIFKSLNKENVVYEAGTLDGNSQGGSNALIIAEKTSGTKNGLRIGKLNFKNQAATETSVRILGASGFEYEGVDVSACNFNAVNTGMSISYSTGGNYTRNKMKTLSGNGIYMTESDENDLSGNHIKSYLSIGIHLNNSDDNTLVKNRAIGTEPYGILTAGTSARNTINLNNVSGGHTTLPIGSASITDIVWHNQGSSLEQGGTSPAAGATGITAFLFTSLEFTSDVTQVGIIELNNTKFYDTILAERDLVWTEEHPYRLFYFSHEPTVDDQIDIYNSAKVIAGAFTPVLDNIIDTFTTGKACKVYSNIRDDETDVAEAVWLLHDEFELVATIGATITHDVSVFAADGVEPIRVDLYQSGSASVEITQFNYDYAGDTNLKVLDDENTDGTALLGTFWLFRKTGINTMTLRMIASGAGVGDRKITAKTYHRKRDVDFVGGLA